MTRLTEYPRRKFIMIENGVEKSYGKNVYQTVGGRSWLPRSKRVGMIEWQSNVVGDHHH